MKIKLGIAGLLTALTLITGGPGGPPAADAASGVSYCFRYAHNGGPVVSAPNSIGSDFVRFALEAYYSDGWRIVAWGKTGSNGCGSFAVSGGLQNRYLRVTTLSHFSPRYYGGLSPNWALPGRAAPFLGTGLVYQL